MTQTNSVKPIKILLALVVVACLAGAAYLGSLVVAQLTAVPQITSVANEDDVVPSLEEASIDFDAICAENGDIQAWLYVPELLNMPVVQSVGSADFYQTHDSLGNKSKKGAVWFDQYNRADLSDAVTVLNGNEAGPLKALHAYDDAEFFASHGSFYLFQPRTCRTYQVVAAFGATDQGVLAKYGYFSTYDQLRAFEHDVLDPTSLASNVDETVSLDDDSKFVVLSTSNAKALASGHYVVIGVQTDVRTFE